MSVIWHFLFIWGIVLWCETPTMSMEFHSKFDENFGIEFSTWPLGVCTALLISHPIYVVMRRV